ncbi:hypothetical protein [Symbiopectobacterium purcellii]|uniref:hypothetical protein n=1 Tax=Symbiopectobacterium purcellii TaxID=2871826 RepID=UPI003F840C55
MARCNFSNQYSTTFYRLAAPYCANIAKRHYFDNSQLCFFAAYQGIGCNHF